MTFKLKQLTAAILMTSSSVAIAVPFASFDTRSMAMGGAGVAVGSAGAAPLFNPALLSVTKAEDDFSLILPTIGVRIADPDNLLDSIDTFNNGNSIDNLQLAIDAFNLSPSTTTATAVANAIPAVSNGLATLSGKPITAEAGLATVVAMPGKKFGSAFYASGTVTAGGLFNYTDGAELQALTADAQLCALAAANQATIDACNRVSNFNTTNSLDSGIRFKGVGMGEIGFAMSREFQVYGSKMSFGITPKIVKATLFDMTIKANDAAADPVTDDYIAEYSFANFDLGVAKEYGNNWRTGFVIKNIIPQTLDFKRAPVLGVGATPVPTGEQLTLKPQARIGVSHSNSWSTVALDVDLTKNSPTGFADSTQYIAIGGELSAWGWAQIRAGYRIDMVNGDRNVYSLGLGLSPFRVVHIDLAVAGNDNEVGASFQFGVDF